MYSKESLERLRTQIDLVEVLSSNLELKKSGSSYKGLCPFHEEKTPSFHIQAGDSHYHCFGCGAHGDAIAFLMNYSKLSFAEAIESLSERFGVTLEKATEKDKYTGPSKSHMREVLQKASRFYNFFLLYTDEGHQALDYLYERGIDLDFIKRFQIGFAPKMGSLLTNYLKKEGYKEELLEQVGLIKRNNNTYREFFQRRITFPIFDSIGHVIGFSARKYQEDTYGPKYINTPETPLFKKSKTLFGMSFSRKRIAKERRAIIVEGQIDALRLIQEGLNIAVAGQGTAFGEDHVKELISLGVHQVYLALDGDDAGIEAANKIGHLFQKEGIEVHVVKMPPGSDPDTILCQHGIDKMMELINQSSDYLSFLFKTLSSSVNINSPAAKNEIVHNIVCRIRSWDHPLMVHESLRKLAHLANVPESLISASSPSSSSVFIKKSGSIGSVDVDPDRILETDLLRWLFLSASQLPDLLQITSKNLKAEDLKIPTCQRIFSIYLEHSEEKKPMDLLSLSSLLDDVEQQLFMSEILQKKVNLEKAQDGLIETLQKILERNWMERREEIKMRIHQGRGSEEELLVLAKEFDEIKRNPPKVCI